MRVKLGADGDLLGRGLSGQYSVIKNVTVKRESTDAPVETGISIWAPYVQISNVSIRGAFSDAGIRIEQSYCSVSNSIVEGVTVGIKLTDIGTVYTASYPYTGADNCVIAGNSILNCTTGIVSHRAYNILSDNQISTATDGISISTADANKNTVSNNFFTSCTSNITLDTDRNHLIYGNRDTSDNGQFVLNHDAAETIAGVVPHVQLHGLTAAKTNFANIRWVNGTGGAGNTVGKSRGATIGTHTVVASGDTLGYLNAVGSDGTAFIAAASITFAVDGTPGTNDMPGRIVFSTTADGAASTTEAMRITAGQEVLIGTTTDNGAYKLQVNSQIFATNATIATSDRAFKSEITPISGGLAAVKRLRPVTYRYKQDIGRDFGPDVINAGFIAQDIEMDLEGEVYRDSVVAQCGEYMGVAYEKLIPVMAAAIQELAAEVRALKSRRVPRRQ